MIVLPTYEQLVEQLADPSTRTRWGVVAKPIQYGDDWCLPLAWEEELKKAEIPFEHKEITILIEEI